MFKFVSRLLNKVSAARDMIISGKSEHWRRVKGGNLMHIPRGAATPPAIIAGIPADADALSMASDALNICVNKRTDVLAGTFKLAIKPNPWIDFIYGNATFGIAHVISERQEYISRWNIKFPSEPCPFPTPTEVLDAIPETLAKGRVVRGRNNYEIYNGDWCVVVETTLPSCITTAYKATEETRRARSRLIAAGG